jgi:[acyl-carrier-protein] S-malonyltransferase
VDFLGITRGSSSNEVRSDLEGRSDRPEGDGRGKPSGLDRATLRERIGGVALAFRGYEAGQLGRSKELVDHPLYGPIVREVLSEATRICGEASSAMPDLVEYVRKGEHGILNNLSYDNAAILAMEIAQLRILEELFEVPAARARLSFGFSTGELAALIFGKVLSLKQVLEVLMPVASDCAELTADARLGMLFTRRTELRPADVDRICQVVLSEGRGLIGPTAFLSPYTALVVGQAEAMDRLDDHLPAYLPGDAVFRRKQRQWTPLHSPLVWQRHIPNRIAMSLHQVKGKLRKPSPPILSCVTGQASYDELSCRNLLTLWPDHPQRLWDVVNATLKSDVDIIIHVGPASKLLTTTFSSLNSRVLRGGHPHFIHRIGSALVSGLQRRPFFSDILPPKAALLRAPFLTHVILEDWLLERKPAHRC